MSSTQNDEEIISTLTEISTESKIILTTIDELKKKIDKASENEEKELLEKAWKDIKDNVARIHKNKCICLSSSPQLQLVVSNLRDPLEEALKIADMPPKNLRIQWFNNLYDQLKNVHSISGRGHVLLTFNEVVLKDRKPGWAIKLHEHLQRYLLYHEDRKMVIQEINSRDNLNALVDEKNDILYVISGGYWKWVKGLGYLLLIFLAGFIVPWSMIYFKYVPAEMCVQNVYFFYILCWFGFALHITLKNKDVRKENPCLEDLFLWIHIKARNFVLAAFTVIAGYIYLLKTGQLDLTTAIASGFAVDSFGSRILHQYYSDLGNAVESLEEEEENSSE